jgi:hypothetical protein
MQVCLFCGGDSSEPNHRQHCDGRQGRVDGFDLHRARVARDEAIARVDAHAADDVKASAFHVAERIARRQSSFTTDEIWKALGPEAPPTHDNRAMGAVMRRVQAAGIARPSPTYRNSEQVVCHSRGKRVWISLVYAAAAIR